MPQLDKLTFTSQVFWFFFLFVILYYSMIQMTLLRIKFILGLKRFFFQSEKNNSFYELSKNLNFSSRYDLLFFFDFYNLNNHAIDQKSSNFSYNLLKNTGNSSMFYSYLEMSLNFLEKLVDKISNLFGNVSKLSDSLYEYNFVLDLNKSNYNYAYNYMHKTEVLDFKDFSDLTKSINFFYEQFLNIFSFFFKSVQFYIYDTVFVLFYYFFNIFFKFREVLYFFRLLNKFSV